ncbi:MAG: translation elongation factor Ts [candidate division Zixibacteria bacterium HGW-Zixibacteria-1]|nr:MAG: translation elongation factor Ts [candidate division Zixibacteria bacterium HGW-Zixibacteria-1]
MEITAQLVKDLRDKTGAGMMDCKKALSETGGDMEKAIHYLREKGIAKAASKAGRSTSEGIIASYIHAGSKLGVLVEINCETDFVARTADFQTFAKDVAMQVAASNPLAVSREELPQDKIAEERVIYQQQALNEGKPEKIVDKIVDGKLEKYYSEVCLLEQPFVKDSDKTIQDLINEAIAKLGENIGVKRFIRFQLGE